MSQYLRRGVMMLTVVVGMAASVRAEEKTLPLAADSFTLSCPAEVAGAAQWKAAESAAELSCPLSGQQVDWAYLSFRLPPQTVPGDAKSVRIRMKAEVPDGILIAVALETDGNAHELTGLKVESGHWGTLTLPFSEFKPAAWNRAGATAAKFVPQQARTLLIGITGKPAATQATATARLLVRQITFLP